MIDDCPGIYAIVNISNGWRYVGSSVCMLRRVTQHRQYLALGKHQNKHLQNAWNKHGESAFVFEMLERVENIITLREREQFHWSVYAPKVYNIAPVTPSEGFYSEKALKARRESQLGKKSPAVVLANARRIHTPEANARQAEKLRGRKHSPEMGQKVRLSKLGKKRSPEACAAISAGRTGKPLSESQLAQLAKARSSRKPRTAESRAKQAASAYLMWERRRAKNAISIPAIH